MGATQEFRGQGYSLFTRCTTRADGPITNGLRQRPSRAKKIKCNLFFFCRAKKKDMTIFFFYLWCSDRVRSVSSLLESGIPPFWTAAKKICQFVICLWKKSNNLFVSLTRKKNLRMVIFVLGGTFVVRHKWMPTEPCIF